MPTAYPLTFTLAARAELIDAQKWYEKEVPGLGRQFRAEVDTAGGLFEPHSLMLFKRNGPPIKGEDILSVRHISWNILNAGT